MYLGKLERPFAIINYRAYLLKPDFFDAYLKLGYSLINAGSLDEVRDLISLFVRIFHLILML